MKQSHFNKLKGTIKEKIDREEVSINSDGNQFMIRIPTLFSKVMKIDENEDSFVFELHLPGEGSKRKKPDLRAFLKKGSD